MSEVKFKSPAQFNTVPCHFTMKTHALFLVVLGLAATAARPAHADMPNNVLCDMRRLALDFAASIMPERATGGGE